MFVEDRSELTMRGSVVALSAGREWDPIYEWDPQSAWAYYGAGGDTTLLGPRGGCIAALAGSSVSLLDGSVVHDCSLAAASGVRSLGGCVAVSGESGQLVISHSTIRRCRANEAAAEDDAGGGGCLSLIDLARADISNRRTPYYPN